MSSLRCGIAGVHYGGNEQITFSTDLGASLDLHGIHWRGNEVSKNIASDFGDQRE
jgi:hypothetical protein